MFKKFRTNKILFFVCLIFFVAAGGFAGAYVLANQKVRAQSSSGCDGYCVRLNGTTADPEVLTITNGSYVQFNSADGGKHNIALEHSAVQHDDPEEYESGDFGGTEGYRVQFKHDGAYTFRDKYHPEIHVNVIVYTTGKSYGLNNN